MRHVRQRGRWDCGVAVVAMAGGVGYGRALERAPNFRRGIWRGAMVEFLGRVTGGAWQVERTATMSMGRVRARAGKAVYLISPPGCGHVLHWVIRCGEMWHDPECAVPAGAGSHPRRDWRVVTVIRRAG